MKKIIYRNWNKLKVIVFILTVLLFDASYIGYKVIKGYYAEYKIMRMSLSGMGGLSAKILVGENTSQVTKYFIEKHGLKNYINAGGWRLKDLDYPVFDTGNTYVRLEKGQYYFEPSYNQWVSHLYGIDMVSKLDLRLKASQSGHIYIGWSKYYGNYIVISKNGMNILYGHLSEMYVKSGDEVERGQLIGIIGNTGRSYGQHLHYQIYQNGEYINPLTITTYNKEVDG